MNARKFPWDTLNILFGSLNTNLSLLINLEMNNDIELYARDRVYNIGNARVIILVISKLLKFGRLFR